VVCAQSCPGGVAVTTNLSTPLMKLANGSMSLVGQNSAQSSYVRLHLDNVEDRPGQDTDDPSR
jgi:hypothetical protein